MRKPVRLYAHDAKGMIPRMSWSPHNLYNLIARSTSPRLVSQITFKQATASMYQQRWRSKRFLRGYHGDWIGERRFRRWYLPTSVPRFSRIAPSSPSGKDRQTAIVGGSSEATEQDRMPVTSLFLREVERRLDTILFRCCFARSAREARSMIVQGKVKLNGVRTTFAGTLLNPGDLLSVEPSAVPMLSPAMAKRAAEQKAKQKDEERERIAKSKARNAQPNELDDAGAQSSAKLEPEQAEAESAVQKTDERADEKAEVVDKADSVRAESQDATETVAGQETTDSEVAQKASSDVEDAAKSIEEASNDKAEAKAQENKDKEKEVKLPEGVLPFNLPPFAAPFLFVPPYLEVSFTTCSAIYMRHPTITPVTRPQPTTRSQQGRESTPSRLPLSQQVAYHSDLPSPYPATSEIFSLAWEMYVRDAPRIRSDVRRLRTEARVGRNGLHTARAREQWRKVLAIRRKRDRQVPLAAQGDAATASKTHNTQFIVGGGKHIVRRKAARNLSKAGDQLGLSTSTAEASKASNYSQP